MNNIYRLIISVFLIIQSIAVLCQTNKKPETNENNTIEFYENMLKKNKKSVFANYGLAYAYYVKGDFSKALKYSKKNLPEKNDYQSGSYLIYGLSLNALGRVSQAIETFETAMALYPHNAQLLYNHALCCYKYRDYKKALNSLDSAIQKAPLYAPSHYLLACVLYESSNDPQCAIPLLYGLTIDNDSVSSNKIVNIAQYLIKGKHKELNVPYFEQRLAINNIDDILNSYIPNRKLNEELNSFSTKDFILQTLDYTEKSLTSNPDNRKFREFYSTFFRSIKSSGNFEAYSWYILRYINKPEINDWFKKNPLKLRTFANQLDKSLPGQ